MKSMNKLQLGLMIGKQRFSTGRATGEGTGTFGEVDQAMRPGDAAWWPHGWEMARDGAQGLPGRRHPSPLTGGRVRTPINVLNVRLPQVVSTAPSFRFSDGSGMEVLFTAPCSGSLEGSGCAQ